MKFIIDENIPKKLMLWLNSVGHDCLRAGIASSDSELARRTRDEERVLITLDNDLVTLFKYSKIKFNLIFIQIHPPYEEDIIEAFKNMLVSVSPSKIKGLIVLQRSGYIPFGE